MNPSPHDDTLALPGWLALTAAAMALMSAHANPRHDLPAPQAERIRALLAHKLLSSLLQLREHPQAPPPLRRVAAQVREHWQSLLEPAAPMLDPRTPDHAAAPRLH